MFEVEALRDSREFSESRFGEVSAVQGTTTGKETILANLGPLADLVDQYASPCNHICVCAYCVEELLETYEEPLCPLCRSVITSYVDVYI
uniref:RING-type domain-containing protein n=1 Tax=Loa loa TaxID=7209 RepID=A0A1I7VQA7_LOALO